VPFFRRDGSHDLEEDIELTLGPETRSKPRELQVRRAQAMKHDRLGVEQGFDIDQVQRPSLVPKDLLRAFVAQGHELPRFTIVLQVVGTGLTEHATFRGESG
jgi:hypothetical protein